MLPRSTCASKAQTKTKARSINLISDLVETILGGCYHMRHSKAIVFRQRVFRQRAPKSIAFCNGHCYRVFDHVRFRLKSLTFENERRNYVPLESGRYRKRPFLDLSEPCAGRSRGCACREQPDKQCVAFR